MTVGRVSATHNLTELHLRNIYFYIIWEMCIKQVAFVLISTQEVALRFKKVSDPCRRERRFEMFTKQG